MGAPLLTVLGLTVRRRTVVLAAMVLFAAANVLVHAPAYPALMAGRVLSGVAVGGFYGVGSVVAPSLVPPERQARAIALMFAGATAGTTLGVPIGTLVGQAAGWRTTFGAVAALGALGVVALAVLLPSTPGEERRDLRAELAALRRPQVLLALALTAASFGAIRRRGLRPRARSPAPGRRDRRRRTDPGLGDQHLRLQRATSAQAATAHTARPGSS